MIIAMVDPTSTRTGRGLRDPGAVVREARRLVGLERHYSCSACGSERRSWTRMSSCPECGEEYVAAVIRRAAMVVV
jgi:hypothetical protein